jgi:hypothetical protein
VTGDAGGHGQEEAMQERIHQATQSAGGAAQASNDVTGQFVRWVQSFFLENMDALFGLAISEFGRDEVRSHLAELADWSAGRLTHRAAAEIGRFLEGAGSDFNLDSLRSRVQDNASWGQILVCLTQEAPAYHDSDLMPKYGQSSRKVGASAGSGDSR